MAGLLEAVLLMLDVPIDANVSMQCGNWWIYRLEDGRVAVSHFDDHGKQLSEELYLDPMMAAQRFCDIARASVG